MVCSKSKSSKVYNLYKCNLKCNDGQGFVDKIQRFPARCIPFDSRTRQRIKLTLTLLWNIASCMVPFHFWQFCILHEIKCTIALVHRCDSIISECFFDHSHACLYALTNIGIKWTFWMNMLRCILQLNTFLWMVLKLIQQKVK